MLDEWPIDEQDLEIGWHRNDERGVVQLNSTCEGQGCGLSDALHMSGYQRGLAIQ